MENVITLGKLMDLLLLFCLPLLLSITVHTKNELAHPCNGNFFFLVVGFLCSCPQTPLVHLCISDGIWLHQTMVQGAGVAIPCTVYIFVWKEGEQGFLRVFKRRNIKGKIA